MILNLNEKEVEFLKEALEYLEHDAFVDPSENTIFQKIRNCENKNEIYCVVPKDNYLPASDFIKDIDNNTVDSCSTKFFLDKKKAENHLKAENELLNDLIQSRFDICTINIQDDVIYKKIIHLVYTFGIKPNGKKNGYLTTIVFKNNRTQLMPEEFINKNFRISFFKSETTTQNISVIFDLEMDNCFDEKLIEPKLVDLVNDINAAIVFDKLSEYNAIENTMGQIKINTIPIDRYLKKNL